MDFETFFRIEYLKNPTQFFSIAFFKYAYMANNMHKDLKVTSNDSYQITITNNDTLFMFRTVNHPLNFDYNTLYKTVVLEETMYHKINKNDKMQYMYTDDIYIKAINRMHNIPNYTLKENYTFKHFKNESITDINAFFDTINKCYTDISITEQDIKESFLHAAYKQGYGVFVFDNNEPIAFGYITADTTINEASIEWLQVLPAYQNKGIGKALLCYLLKQVPDMNFTVVTFKRQANLMRLYSKCGFEEFTTWYILKFTPRIDIKNYTDLDRKMIELTTTKEKPKLLIHSCCGPCSSYIIDYLKNYFEITIYYYNPNIYPKEEYDKRLLTQKQIADILLLKQGQIPPVIEGIYDYSLFENWTKTTLEKEKGNRCYQCYYMRIEEAANYAKKHNFDYYTTTLSISPHKNADWINEIGFLASKKYQINFLYSNFKLKEGYKKSIELSKKYALYRQNYCGCKHSMENE